MWHFISSWVLGGRDVGLSLDLGFGGWGECVFLSGVLLGGGGGFTLIFYIGDFLLINVFSLFCGGTLLIFV